MGWKVTNSDNRCVFQTPIILIYNQLPKLFLASSAQSDASNKQVLLLMQAIYYGLTQPVAIVRLAEVGHLVSR